MSKFPDILLLTEETRPVLFGARSVEVRLVKMARPFNFSSDAPEGHRIAQMNLIRKLRGLPKTVLVSLGPGHPIYRWGESPNVVSVSQIKMRGKWVYGTWTRKDDADVAEERFVLSVPPLLPALRNEVEDLHEAMGDRLPPFQFHRDMLGEGLFLSFKTPQDRAIGKLYVPSSTPVYTPSDPDWRAD